MTQNPRPVALSVQERGASGSPARQGAEPDEEKLPRLIRYQGTWHCYRRGDDFHVTCGLGRTPLDAWIDWKIQSNKNPEAQADSCVQLKG